MHSPVVGVETPARLARLHEHGGIGPRQHLLQLRRAGIRAVALRLRVLWCRAGGGAAVRGRAGTGGSADTSSAITATATATVAHMRVTTPVNLRQIQGRDRCRIQYEQR